MGCVSSTLTYRTKNSSGVSSELFLFCFWRNFGEIGAIRLRGLRSEGNNKIK